MNRSLGYWIEKLLGYICGLLLVYIAYRNYSSFGFISDVAFLDKVISISSTLFGFLLAILTLILQGNSPTVTAMKRHGSYNRLINLNKTTVISAIICCVISLAICFCATQIKSFSTALFEFVSTINFGLFGCVIINSILFTLIFYKIVINDQ